MHRDVKPANVLVSDDGHVYLSDFGLTRRTKEARALTESGTVVGTLDYVAPEQIENRDVSAQTDIYALACLFFECLTGEVPFEADSKVGVMFAHLQDERPSASERLPGLPTAVDAVLGRGMAKREQDRYPSAGELAREAKATLGLSGDLGAALSARPRDRRRLLVLVAFIAIVVAAAAVAAAALLTGGGEELSVGDD